MSVEMQEKETSKQNWNTQYNMFYYSQPWKVLYS